MPVPAHCEALGLPEKLGEPEEAKEGDTETVVDTEVETESLKLRLPRGDPVPLTAVPVRLGEGEEDLDTEGLLEPEGVRV